MAKKKAAKFNETGAIERMLAEQKKDQRIAEKGAFLPIAIAPDEVFFGRNKIHKYGTCWKCGADRAVGGGLPGGFDAYWCKICNCYLAIRESRSDTAKINVPTKTD